jgi:hypothetical protein
MLIISGDKDHTVPPAVAKASYRLEQRNGGVTDFLTIENRSHSLTIDSGWRRRRQSAGIYAALRNCERRPSMPHNPARRSTT